jgi:hypothetical protein
VAEQFAFMSDGWLTGLQQEAQKLLDGSDKPQATFTYIEWFTDPPTPRANGKQVGYVMSVSSGTVAVRSGVEKSDTGDCTVQMGYTDALATTSVPAGPGLDAIGAKGYAAGTLVVTGSPAGMPFSMNSLHDAMCLITGT